jgi:thiol-disulfide isomerase/thioredoxin
MTEKPAYYDIRSELWISSWEAAKSSNDFLLGAPIEQITKWGESFDRAPELTEEQVRRLTGYNRILHVLMVGGTWCGDCSRTAPYLMKITEAAGEKVNFRIIDRDASPKLKDEIRIMGGPRVPVVIFLTEDWLEAGRFSDRTLTVYRSKMAREVGRGVDQGVLSPQARERELSEWVDLFERILIMLRVAPALRKKYGD